MSALDETLKHTPSFHEKMRLGIEDFHDFYSDLNGNCGEIVAFCTKLGVSVTVEYVSTNTLVPTHAIVATNLATLLKGFAHPFLIGSIGSFRHTYESGVSYFFTVLDLNQLELQDVAKHVNTAYSAPRDESYIAEVLRIAVLLALAIAHLHARGVVHGGVKPSTVFITPGGEVVLGHFHDANMVDKAGRCFGAWIGVRCACFPDLCVFESPPGCRRTCSRHG